MENRTIMAATESESSRTVPDERPWRTRYDVVICHPSAARILLMPADDAWALPRWQDAARHWFKGTSDVTRGLRERFGLDGIVLRYAGRHDDEDARLVTAYCIVEPRGEWKPPHGARWIDALQLDRAALARPEQRAVIARVLDELAGGPVPPERNPYAMPGWFAAASTWMNAKLHEAGRPALGPVEQVKTWGISCVLRARTSDGDVYLKAPSQHFAQEARITQLLADWYPDRVPGVVAIDAARSWLLLDDVGPPLFQHTARGLWERAVDLIGELQRGCARRTGELHAAGAQDRRLTVLREQIGWMADAPEVRADAPPALVERLARAVPQLQALCDTLSTLGPAETLVHGDLHGGNVGVRDGVVRFFDWTDACLAHPFLDLVTLLPEPGQEAVRRGGYGDAHAPLRDRYLAGFTGEAAAEPLRRAFDLAWCLGTLHQVVSYIGIARSLEPGARTEFSGALSSWLRKGLERLDGLRA